mmetsp:Transcript_31203/g.79448  ORF Transcript_31203/g.79448 Transcript_31203/m.79448 type:complete len:256 (+) Transcript_31203:137-904(+)
MRLHLFPFRLQLRAQLPPVGALSFATGRGLLRVAVLAALALALALATSPLAFLACASAAAFLLRRRRLARLLYRRSRPLVGLIVRRHKSLALTHSDKPVETRDEELRSYLDCVANRHRGVRQAPLHKQRACLAIWSPLRRLHRREHGLQPLCSRLRILGLGVVHLANLDMGRLDVAPPVQECPLPELHPGLVRVEEVRPELLQELQREIPYCCPPVSKAEQRHVVPRLVPLSCVIEGLVLTRATVVRFRGHEHLL